MDGAGESLESCDWMVRLRLPARWRSLFAQATRDEFVEPFVEDDALRIRHACALVRDAVHGATPEHRLCPRALAAWELYHTRPAKLLRYLNVGCYLAIAAFETPRWCVTPQGTLLPECSDPDIYARYTTYGLRPLTLAAATGLETICVCIFILQLSTKLYYMGMGRFARARWPLVQSLLLLIAILDLIFTASPILWWRSPFSRPLRAVFVIFSHRKVRDTRNESTKRPDRKEK